MRRAITFVVVNLVGIALLLFVRQDLLWRTSLCVSDPRFPCRAPVSSIAYYPFTMVTTVPWSGFDLRSPLTLDWTQVLVVALLVFDFLYAYSFVKGRRRQVMPAAP